MSMGENRKALPPGLRYDAVDTHEVRGVGLFKAPIHIVEFRWPSLGWHGLSPRSARARNCFALRTGDKTPIAHNHFQWQAELPNPFKVCKKRICG